MSPARDALQALPAANAIRRMTGRELLHAILDGRITAPPITRTLGFRLAEVGDGSAVFEGTPGEAHLNPMGSVHGGWFGTLLDSCMGCAIHSRLPAGVGYATLEYKVNIIRGAGVDTGLLRAVGNASHVGRRTGVAEGRLVDSEGRLYATGTTTCLIVEL